MDALVGQRDHSAWGAAVIVETRVPDEFLEPFPTARSVRGYATRSGRSERYRSGMRVTGGLVWPLPARSGGFEALGRRPADLDRAGEALAERGRGRSRPYPGSVEPPPPLRSATRVRVCMPCQNAGSNGRSSPGRHAPATRAACDGNSGGMRRRLERHATADPGSGGTRRRRGRQAATARAARDGGSAPGPRPAPLGPREQPSGYRPL